MIIWILFRFILDEWYKGICMDWRWILSHWRCGGTDWRSHDSHHRSCWKSLQNRNRRICFVCTCSFRTQLLLHSLEENFHSFPSLDATHTQHTRAVLRNWKECFALLHALIKSFWKDDQIAISLYEWTAGTSHLDECLVLSNKHVIPFMQHWQ